MMHGFVRSNEAKRQAEIVKTTGSTLRQLNQNYSCRLSSKSSSSNCIGWTDDGAFAGGRSQDIDPFWFTPGGRALPGVGPESAAFALRPSELWKDAESPALESREECESAVDGLHFSSIQLLTRFPMLRGGTDDRVGEQLREVAAAEATEERRETEDLSMSSPLFTDIFGIVILVCEITGVTDENIAPAEDIRLGVLGEE